jgi:PGF-pre-PGF domain-containing protein
MRGRMKQYIYISLVFTLLFTGVCFANFECEPSVSSSGMGGVLPVDIFQPSMMSINPAILSMIPRKMVETSYSRYYCPIENGMFSSGFVGYAMPLENYGCLGLNAVADLEGKDKELLTTVSYSDSFIFPGKVSLGVGLDIYTRFLGKNSIELKNPTVDTNFCQSYGVNGGIIIRPVDQFLIGLSAFNLNRPKLTYGDMRKLPLKARLDIGANIYNIRPCFSLNYRRDFENNTFKVSYDLGFEAGIFGNLVRLRAGYNHSLSGGVGFGFQKGDVDFAVDYAFQLSTGDERLKNPSGNHILGVSFTFGNELSKYKSSKILDTFRLNFNDVIVKEVSVKTCKFYKDELDVSANGKLEENEVSEEDADVGREIVYGSVSMDSNIDPYDISGARVIFKIRKDWLEDNCVRHDNIRFHVVSNGGEYVLDYVPTFGYSDDEYYYFESNIEMIAPMVITAFIEPKKKEIAVLEKEKLPEKPEAVWPKEHKVVKGECLFIIAGFEYHDPFKWKNIFEANRDKIKDPHWIYPGQVFIIPSPN